MLCVMGRAGSLVWNTKTFTAVNVVASALMILVLPNLQSQTHRVTIPIANDFERHVHCRTWAQGVKSPTSDHSYPGSPPVHFHWNLFWINWHRRGVCSSTLVFLFQYYFQNIPHTHTHTHIRLSGEWIMGPLVATPLQRTGSSLISSQNKQRQAMYVWK